MRKLLVLCGVAVCLSLPAAAQESAAAFDASSPAAEPAAAPASPVSFEPSERDPWEIGLGFQFQHMSFLGETFRTYGYNVGITRYINNWFGIEGAGVIGFGTSQNTPSIGAKSFFIAGGPHIVFNHTHRLQPWIHVLSGWQHFRIEQTATLGSNSSVGFMGGAGLDVKFGSHAAWRIQGDYVGSHFGQSLESNYSIGTGLTFAF